MTTVPGTARLREMRELRDAGMTLAEIGRRYGVTGPRVSQLLGPDGRYCRTLERPAGDVELDRPAERAESLQVR